MLNPYVNRDVAFVITYFNRVHEIDATGGLSNRLDLLIQGPSGGVIYWFTNRTGQVTDMEQFIYDVLRRNV